MSPSFSLSRLGLGLLAALAVFSLTPLAAAEDLAKTYNGKLVISAEAFPKKLDEELSKFLKTTVKKDGGYEINGDGKSAWQVNLLAFLSKDPGSEPVTLVFYDSENKEAQKNLEPVQSVELSSSKGVRILRLSELKLSPDSGFTAGKTYLVKATQIRGNKEVVLAQAKLTLTAK